MTYYIAEAFIVRDGERFDVEVPTRLAEYIESVKLSDSGWYTDGRSGQYGAPAESGWMHASEVPGDDWFTEDGYYFTVLDLDADMWAVAYLPKPTPETTQM